MATKFIGKILHKKTLKLFKKPTNHKAENKIDNNNVIDNDIKVEETKKENKIKKKGKDMISENKLAEIENIVGISKNVKIEKSDKGLFEKTENSTILLTEDNKMLLTD